MKAYPTRTPQSSRQEYNDMQRAILMAWNFLQVAGPNDDPDYRHSVLAAIEKALRHSGVEP